MVIVGIFNGVEVLRESKGSAKFRFIGWECWSECDWLDDFFLG